MAEIEDREDLLTLSEQIFDFINNVKEKYKYTRKHCEDHYTERKLLFSRLLNNDFQTENDPVTEDKPVDEEHEPVGDNLVSNSTLNSSRKRKASRLASMKIKRNINIPLKLRRSRRTGNVFDRSLKVNEDSKKVSRSKDRNRSDSEWESENDNKVGSNLKNKMSKKNHTVIAVVTEQVEEAVTTPQPVTPPQPLQRNTPISLVKLRAMQFEKLVAQGNLEEKENLKNSTFVQKKKAIKTDIINPAAGSSKQNFNSPKQNSKGTGAEKTEPDQNLNGILADLDINVVGMPSASNVPNIVVSSTPYTVSPIASTTTRVTRAMKNALSNSCSVHSSTSSTKSGRNTTKEMNAKDKTTSAKKNQSKTTVSKSKKKVEVGKTNAEALRKQHEDRHKRVIAAREAAYAQRQLAEQEYLRKKEERMKAKAAERERLQKEEEARKAAVAQQKKLEMEERRKREEAARNARLLEIEEERKRNEATFKKKQEEEADLLAQKKLAQKNKTQKQLKGKDCGDTSAAAAAATASGGTFKIKIAKVVLTNLEINQNATYCKVADADSSNMTADQSSRKLRSPASANNYGLDEAATSDSSEDEEHPRKKIPDWALPQKREINDMITAFVPLKVHSIYFKCNRNPDIVKLMGVPSFASKRQRTSSAMWTTPPIKH